MAVFFNGRKLVTPTTASAVNDDAMLNQNVATGNVAALVGRSAGGKPKTALHFGSPQQAKATLVSGELLDAVLKAFNPSNDTGGPAEVVAFRVNPAEQATLTLTDSDGNDAIKLTSANYGQYENQIRVRVEDGSDSGLRITTTRGNIVYAADNVGRVAFSCRYTGSETDASIEVSDSAVVLKAPASGAGTSLDLDQYATIGALVDAINTQSDWTATVQDRSDQLASKNALDTATIADAKTADVNVRADLQAAVDWFNSPASGLVDAERADNATKPPKAIGYTFLTGGSDGTATNQDWSDALDAAQRADIQWISVVTGDDAIHAMLDAHVQFCSTELGRERRGIVGTELAADKADVKTRAKGLNSDRTSLLYQGYWDYDATGKLVLFPAYMSAALIVGAFAGVSPGTPLTNKTINVRGLEFGLLNPTETDEMIEAGVLCLEDTEQGYKVVQSITTWLTDTKYDKREQSCGAALDYTVRTVRESVDVVRGEKAGPRTQSRTASIAQTTLTALAVQEPNGPGVIVGDANSPAFRNITASTDGDATRLQFECSPAIPNNYVLVTVYAVPYSGSTTA